MDKKRAIVAFAVLICLTFTLCSCYSEDEYNKAIKDKCDKAIKGKYESGYTDGYWDGYDKAYKKGYKKGYKKAKKKFVSPQPKKQTTSYTVYYTNTGSKYHAAGCMYLRYSSHPCTVQQARNMGLSPCSVCAP